MLIPFKWKEKVTLYTPPSPVEIIMKYRDAYQDLRYTSDARVLEEALVRKCKGVSLLDRWATWVYMQDKGLSWKRVYDRIKMEDWRKRNAEEQRESL